MFLPINISEFSSPHFINALSNQLEANGMTIIELSMNSNKSMNISYYHTYHGIKKKSFVIPADSYVLRHTENWIRKELTITTLIVPTRHVNTIIELLKNS